MNPKDKFCDNCIHYRWNWEGDSPESGAVEHLCLKTGCFNLKNFFESFVCKRWEHKPGAGMVPR